MAQRRMFSIRIVGSDQFLDMPISSQALYFHLGMYADDDGFVSPLKVIRIIGANNDDLKLLANKGFIIPFENGVIVITNWKENNYIQSDRYQQTIFTEQKEKLKCIQNVYKMDTQVRLELGKDRIEIGEEREESKREKTISPSDEAIDFFAVGDTYHKMLDLYSKDKDKNHIEKEFKKFILYWTEKNKSGTKQRWQLQTTFEVKRRLYTWLSRSNMNIINNQDKSRSFV